MGAFALQVDLLLYATLSKQVMAAPNSLFETQPLEQMAQVVETDRRVGGPAQEPLECPLGPHNAILYANLRPARPRPRRAAQSGSSGTSATQGHAV
jgi:hypothetical protein